MNSIKSLRWLNIVGLVITLLLNGLANGLPLNGRTTGELSELYPNLFVPAGFTFGIWGLIYLLLISVAIVQFRSSSEGWLKRIGPWFFVSSLANASWIIAWHYLQVTLSLLIMLAILLSLLIIFIRLRSAAPADATERWLVRPTFSVYLGWISVATVANFTTLLVDAGWDGGALGPVSWTAVMIAVVTILGLFVIWRTGALPYVLVLLWAFYGIYSKQSINEGADVQPIMTAIYVGGALLALSVVGKLISSQRS